MKRTIAIMLLLCLTVQTMAQLAVVGLFEVNRDYIARNLCENRDKPQLSCCGKCYLGKQLRKTDEEGKPSGNTPAKVIKAEVAPCFIPAPIVQPETAQEAVAAAEQNPRLPKLHDRLRTSAIFHPPASC